MVKLMDVALKDFTDSHPSLTDAQLDALREFVGGVDEWYSRRAGITGANTYGAYLTFSSKKGSAMQLGLSRRADGMPRPTQPDLIHPRGVFMPVTASEDTLADLSEAVRAYQAAQSRDQ